MEGAAVAVPPKIFGVGAGFGCRLWPNSGAGAEMASLFDPNGAGAEVGRPNWTGAGATEAGAPAGGYDPKIGPRIDVAGPPEREVPPEDWSVDLFTSATCSLSPLSIPRLFFFCDPSPSLLGMPPRRCAVFDVASVDDELFCPPKLNKDEFEGAGALLTREGKECAG